MALDLFFYSQSCHLHYSSVGYDRKYFSVGAILGLIVFYSTRYFESPYRKVLLGPRGYPFKGNLFEMKKWRTMAQFPRMA